MAFENFEVWFVTGAQLLYGGDAVIAVDAHSTQMVKGLNDSGNLPVKVVYKGTVNSEKEVTATFKEANNCEKCIGVITWMHTFSPAKMWIHGLQALDKPLLHFHTQFNKEIPWDTMDMDFMNLNQSAHGDREHGFIGARMRLNRKVVVGYWQDAPVRQKIGSWMRSAVGAMVSRGLKVMRFGDNMREVAVTEGDKVEAQIRFGLAVNGYGVGDIVKIINEVSEADIDKQVQEYATLYTMDAAAKPGAALHSNVRYQARIELGLRSFLEKGGFKGFTTTFEDLHGLEQLPGLASQRLMASGYGFGAEGDWKHAALVRALKVMGAGLEGGCSFMEDYTYHLDPKGMMILGAHMLEVCPTIGKGKLKLEVHPLGIGNKAAPARLVFDVPTGPAVVASLIDMGNRFRMIVNAIDCVDPNVDLPKLPVARAIWVPQPDLKTGAAAWIYAGGAHHTAFSQAITSEAIEDFSAMAGIECVVIDKDTRLAEFKKELRWNEAYYQLAGRII